MKRVFLLITGIVLIGGFASAQINVGGGVSAILGTELYLYTQGGEAEQYDDLLSVGLNGHVDVGAPLAFFLDVNVALAMQGSEKIYVNGELVVDYPPFAIEEWTQNFVLSGLAGAGINLPLGQFNLFAGGGGHIYMYTYDSNGSDYVDQLSLGVGAMANIIFPMGSYSLYAGGSVAYDFYHINAATFDDIYDNIDDEVGLGILVASVSIGASIEF